MHPNLLFRTAALVTIGLATTTVTHAAPVAIPIVNFSFENAQIPGGPMNPLAPATNNGFSSDGTQRVPGWTTAGGWIGLHNPTGTGQFSSNVAPDGSNVAYNDGGAISQVLTSDLSLGTYDLTVAVGHRSTATFNGGELELFAGSTLLDSFSLTDPGTGLFKDETLSYTAVAGNANLGQSLEIALVGNGGGFNQVPAGVVDFDDARLEFAASPEPSVPALLLGGVVLLVGARQMRRLLASA